MFRSLLTATLMLSLAALAEPPKKSDPKTHTTGQGESIRGTMSLNEIAKATGVPLAHFEKALKLDKSVDRSKPVREWIHSKGMTMQHVREAAAAYKPVQK